jgi:putative methionine-R-sulfoxide reductase with GAF domain
LRLFVVYLKAGEALRQVAAWGPKRDRDGHVIAPLIQRIGEGIVGCAAAGAEALLVPDINDDARYLHDITECRSELAVPVVYAGQVVGVIDAENPSPSAFTDCSGRG